MTAAVTHESFLDSYVALNPKHAYRDGDAIRQHDARRYVALPCRGCCVACPGWHLVHDEDGARALHRRLFG